MKIQMWENNKTQINEQAHSPTERGGKGGSGERMITSITDIQQKRTLLLSQLLQTCQIQLNSIYLLRKNIHLQHTDLSLNMETQDVQN